MEDHFDQSYLNAIVLLMMSSPLSDPLLCNLPLTADTSNDGNKTFKTVVSITTVSAHLQVSIHP